MPYQSFVFRIFSYLKPHSGKLVFASMMMVLSTLLEATMPEITGRIVDELFTIERSKTDAIFYVVALFTIISTSAIFAFTSIAASTWVSNSVITQLRLQMFVKLLRLPKAYFDRNKSGRILSKLTFDVGQIAAAASVIWLEFVKSSVSAIALISYLFYKNWQLSMILTVLLPLIFFTIKYSAKKMRRSSKNVQDSMGKMTHLLSDNISANSLIKIYHAQDQETNKFKALIKNIRQQGFKVEMTGAANAAFVNLLIGAALSVVVYLTVVVLKLSAGEFISFFTALGMLIKPIKNLVNINKPMQQSIAAGDSVFGLLDEKEEQNRGTRSLNATDSTINFENVSFGFSAKNKVLNNIDLEIKAGETVALVGTTGSGKSTIVQLLCGFYSPDEGVIKVGGVDIADFEVDSLRKNIAFVDQTVRLFNGSIRDNIALGQADLLADEAIKNAAKVASADKFIQNLAEQFDTEVGDDGVRLSGGQRQRIAIARAVAKNSPILILDEATSALDSTTEIAVADAINTMQNGRTTIIIAHRLSTIQKADKIIVLKQGSIIETGSHQELLGQNGEYAKLYKHQFKD